MEKYIYSRYVWWDDVDVDTLAVQLSGDYEIKHLDTPGESRYEISLYMNTRREVLVKADTLSVYIGRFKALLFQRETKPFTERDLRLRERILEVYRRNRPSPFPWLFSFEPRYEVALSKSTSTAM